MVPPPGLDRPPSLGDGPEPVDVQAFVAQRPVERLDVDVVPWFPRARSGPTGRRSDRYRSAASQAASFSASGVGSRRWSDAL